jgi:hypothetical protein
MTLQENGVYSHTGTNPDTDKLSHRYFLRMNC